MHVCVPSTSSGHKLQPILVETCATAEKTGISTVVRTGSARPVRYTYGINRFPAVSHHHRRLYSIHAAASISSTWHSYTSNPMRTNESWQSASLEIYVVDGQTREKNIGLFLSVAKSPGRLLKRTSSRSEDCVQYHANSWTSQSLSKVNICFLLYGTG